MSNLYPNLPGISVDLVERVKAETRRVEEGTTPSLLILGTASDGPLFTPVSVSSAAEAESIFGPAELPGFGRPSLSRDYWVAEKMGARDIRLMKISGAYATGTLFATPKVVTSTKTVREDLGVAPGNIETVITFNLSAASDVLKSTNVIADGLVLPSTAYTAEKNPATAQVTVTIAPEKTSTDVPIRVDYIYAHTTPTAVTDGVMNPVAGSGFTQYYSEYQNWDSGVAVVVEKNGVEVQATDYTVDYEAGMITFINPCLEEDVITASFTYLLEGEPISASANGIASGVVRSFQLSQVPKSGTFVLLTTDGPIVADGYTLAAELKTVTLKSGYVKRGVTVTASYEYEVSQNVTPTIEITSVGAAAVYNDVKIAVREVLNDDGELVAKEFVVTKPAKKRFLPSEPALVYSSQDYSTFGALVQAVNTDPRNNVVRLTASHRDELVMNLATTADVGLAGGDDGLDLSPYDFYKQLEGERDAQGNIVKWGAYPLLEHYRVDHIVLSGLYFDDDLGSSPDVNFGQQLAQFCAVSSMYQHNVLGYIGVKPIDNPTLATVATRANATAALEHVFYMKNIRGEYMKDQEGNNIDISKYVSIVSYPDFLATHPRLGQFIVEPAVAYAAKAASVAPDFGTTWEPMEGLELRYELANVLRSNLVGAQYVTFETSWIDGRNVPVVTAGVTAAKTGTDYDSLHSMKAAIAATNAIRAVSAPYIGKPYGMAKRQAHGTAIERVLESMISRGSLADFTYSIHIDPTSRMLRRAIVELHLVTNPELRNLDLMVTIEPRA